MKFVISEIEKKEILEKYGLLKEQVSETPICNEYGCSGKYTGPESNSQGDIAHQYSNVITKAVAAKLKSLYTQGKFSKVDFENITMTTQGMGTGNVVYTVDIPFVSVSDKCDAMTGFAHVGGWGHKPELSARKNELLGYVPKGKNQNVILGDELYVSKLNKTPEGLEEYWIQWKHRDFQSECENVSTQVTTKKQSSQVTIKGISLDDLRNQMLQQKNISIDPDSFEVDLDSNTITFSTGDTKVDHLSFIFDDRGQLNNRLNYMISPKNPSMVVAKVDVRSNPQYAVLYFK